METKTRWLIMARRPNDEVLYLWQSETQGDTLVPNGISGAAIFTDLESVAAKRNELAAKYKGLWRQIVIR